MRLTFYPCHGILFLSIQWIQCSQATKACSLCRVPPTEMKKEMDPDYDKEMHLFHLGVGQVFYGICVEARGETLHVGCLFLPCLRLAFFAVACSRLVGSWASRSLYPCLPSFRALKLQICAPSGFRWLLGNLNSGPYV